MLIATFGLALATVPASTSALVADLSQAKGRGGAMGILSSIMDISRSMRPMLSGLMIGLYSYRTTFDIIGIGLIIVAFIYGIGMRRWAIRIRVTE